MKIEIRVAWVLRYIGSSTTCTSTTLPSAGAITYCSPRGPVRDGSRKKTSRDRKSTRLNSSHSQISYAVFCLKKKDENAPKTKAHDGDRCFLDVRSSLD